VDSRSRRFMGRRVLFLGDSFTYGLGVNDDQTFAVRVEKDLRADRLSVEVMNAGAFGKGTDYALKCFRTVGRKFHPGLIVLGFLATIFRTTPGGSIIMSAVEGNSRLNP
jgi:hypothetical protein